jgi:3-hydroxyacyl-[acyl-carrier-protein] dehydratase
MDAAPATLESMDILRLFQLLPHRYPFLMVDRIERIVGIESAVGIKNVTANEPQFQGHFPGRPIMPGVLLIEGIAQTAGAICINAAGLEQPSLVYFLTIDQCKFRRPVTPGDVVEYHVKKLRQRGTLWKYSGEVRVGEHRVAEAVVSAMIAPG